MEGRSDPAFSIYAPSSTWGSGAVFEGGKLAKQLVSRVSAAGNCPSMQDEKRVGTG